MLLRRSPPEVDALIKLCLKFDTEMRPSMGEVIKRLQEIIGQAVPAERENDQMALVPAAERK